MSAVNISTASVPEAWCNLTLQEIWPKLASLLQVEIPSTDYNFGPDTPAPDKQDKPWLKTDASYVPDRWYVYSSGAWIAKHPDAPGKIVIYDGLEADIATYDGGEAGTVTATTGPMWEKYTPLNARFPIGIGTLPSGKLITLVGADATGGEEKHELVESELPNIEIHSRQRTDLQDGGGSAALLQHDTFGTQVTVDEFGGDADGDTEAHNNMPPYAGVIFIKKTARTHYRI